MDKLVSIGMSVYNCSLYIEASINSIINQTYTNWELIVTDDGSIDDTFEKLTAFAKIDNRIKIFRDKKNCGLSQRLNECIELSSGEYFARMDGDDIMTLDRLERQVKFLDSHPELDIIGSLIYIIDENNNVIGTSKHFSPRNLREIILTGGYFKHPTVLGKMNWFRLHKYDQNSKILHSQDIELWVRAYNTSVYYILEEYLLFYRVIASVYKVKYYKSYLDLKNILTKHREKISTILYIRVITVAYVKYLFFDFFSFLGLLHKRQFVPPQKLMQFQNQLNSILELKKPN